MEGFLRPLITHWRAHQEETLVDSEGGACGEAQYYLPLAPHREPVELHSLVGRGFEIEFLGPKSCVSCGCSTAKTFSSGYCFSCFRALAAADLCIVKPETCHFSAGTCREPRWGVRHCMIPHTVYLAVSSGLKVGITRAHQRMHRWISQGAVQAIELGRTPVRKEAGLVEVTLKKSFQDRTDPRRMLTSTPPPRDLVALRREVLESEVLADLNFEPSSEGEVRIHYPGFGEKEEDCASLQWFQLDQHGHMKGILEGIKGQYLLLKEEKNSKVLRALNIKKHAGYKVRITPR